MIITGIIAGFTYLFGKPDSLLYTLALFIGLDYFTGVFVSVKLKMLSSKISIKRIMKKLLIAVVIMIAVCIDHLNGAGNIFRTLACGFYISNEGISILENISTLGVPVPKKLLNVLCELEGAECGNSDSGTKEEN